MRLRLLIGVVCLLVLAAIVTSALSTPLRIWYHRYMLERIYEEIYSEPTVTSGGLVGYRMDSELLERQDQHCDRLVALGYFFHDRYAMENLPDTGKVHSAFWRLVTKHFPDRRYVTLSHPDNVLEVWDLAEDKPKWDAFVRTHNVRDFADRFMATAADDVER